VAFTEAQPALIGELAYLISVPDRSSEQHICILLCMNIDSRLLVACHCLRSEDFICTISARKEQK